MEGHRLPPLIASLAPNALGYCLYPVFKTKSLMSMSDWEKAQTLLLCTARTLQPLQSWGAEQLFTCRRLIRWMLLV